MDLIPDAAMAAFADVLDGAKLDADAKRDDTHERFAATAADARLALASDLDTPPDDLSGRLQTPADLRRYILAGHGTITVVSRRTAKRFTYRLSTPKKNPNGRIYVRVLTGPSNEGDYQWLGTLWTEPSAYRGRTYPPRFSHSHKSRISPHAPSAHAAAWLLDRVVRGSDETMLSLLQRVEVWHEGHCGACGRKLTVPESIATGIGPVCAERLS